MINLILQESKKYLDSPEYLHSLETISNNFSLDEDESAYVSVAAQNIITGAIAEENFIRELRDLSEIKSETVNKIYIEAKRIIFAPFKNYINKVVNNSDSSQESVGVPSSNPAPTVSIPSSANTLRQQPTPEDHQTRLEESLTKAHLLSQIENPPRTVIKKYVFEHEPITDTEHLIDDSIDTRPRLEA